MAIGTAQTNPNLTRPTGNPMILAAKPMRKIARGAINQGGRGASGAGDTAHSFHQRAAAAVLIRPTRKSVAVKNISAKSAEPPSTVKLRGPSVHRRAISGT